MRSQLAEFETIPSERLADLLMLSHEAMFAWKLDGAIEFWNAGAERLYGFPPNEAIGHSSHSLLQTKFPIKVAELHSQLRDKGYWAGELRHVCKERREVIVDSRMQLLADDKCLRSIATSRNSKRSWHPFKKANSVCAGLPLSSSLVTTQLSAKTSMAL